MNPYNKSALRKLRQTIDTLLQTVREDEKTHNTYKSYSATSRLNAFKKAQVFRRHLQALSARL
jgi:hypothetical protein